jgi:hypothetical protein
VPAEYIRENAGAVPIAVGGGAPIICGHITRGALIAWSSRPMKGS